MTKSLLALCVAVACLATLGTVAYAEDFSGGWRLNPAASHFVDPQNAPKDIIWQIKIDGSDIQWHTVVIPATGQPRFESFDNDLGASPKPISGSSSGARAEAVLNKEELTVHIIPSTGQFSDVLSTCALSSDKKQLTCRGKAKKPEGGESEFNLTFDRM